jgi:hypothetical protein
MKPCEVLTEAGVSEREAWSVVAVFFCETWPRLRRLQRGHGLHRLKGIRSVVRCVPWPHVTEYNDVLARLVMASSASEAHICTAGCREQVVRRLLRTTVIFGMFGHAEFDREAYAPHFRSLTRGELMVARERIVSLLLVGEDGEADGVSFGGSAWLPRWAIALRLAQH